MSIQGLPASFAQPAVAATASLSPAASGPTAIAPMNSGASVAIHSPDGSLDEIRSNPRTHAQPQVFSPDDAHPQACADCGSHGASASGAQAGGGQGAQAGGGDQGGAGAAQLGKLLSSLLKMAVEGASKAIPAMAGGGA
ncbi:hypothetical protein GCM10027093_49530 [Paraburkholderia jirisanensis]